MTTRSLILPRHLRALRTPGGIHTAPSCRRGIDRRNAQDADVPPLMAGQIPFSPVIHAFERPEMAVCGLGALHLRTPGPFDPNAAEACFDCARAGARVFDAA